MKRYIFLVLLFVATLTCYADVDLESGNLAAICHKGRIAVTSDWSKAVYRRSGTLEDFLHLRSRSKKWEEVSLRAFCREAGEFTAPYGVRFVVASEAENPKVSCKFIVLKISKGGDIEGIMELRDTESGDLLATLEFSSDEADDDEYTAFEEQFETIGESFGKVCRKVLKKKCEEL